MEVSREIRAPVDRVWTLLTDTRCWPLWGPSVTAVDCADRFITLGSRGTLRTPLGVWLPFRVTLWEPPRRWDWRVAGIPATGHRVDPLGPDRCRVVFEIPAAAWPYAWICRRAAGRLARLAERTE